MAEKKPARPHTGARIALITLVTFGLAVVILATIKRSQQSEAIDEALQLAPAPPVAEAGLAPPAAAAPPTKAPTPAPAPTPTKAVTKTASVAHSKTEEPRPGVSKVEEPPASSIKAEVITPAPEPPAAAAHMEAARETALVTIEGCLERKGDHFRLSDTEGDNAPKSRSWKTGFLRKRSRTLDVTDAPNGLLLRGYTGRRVSVTGTFIDGELHARSLKNANGSCN